MSQVEIGELLGTLSRDKQRAQQPLNQFYADQQKQLLSEKAVKPLEDYAKASHDELRVELRRVIKSIKQQIEEIQNEQMCVDDLRVLNNKINQTLTAKYEISKIIDEACPKLKYKYFGAYRDYLLKTGKKKLVREILDSSEGESDEPNEASFSFERKKRKSKQSPGMEKSGTPSTMENYANIPFNAVKPVKTLAEKIHTLFHLQNGCTTIYAQEPETSPPIQRFAKDIEFTEEEILQLEKQAEDRWMAIKRQEKIQAERELEERKRRLLEKYTQG